MKQYRSGGFGSCGVGLGNFDGIHYGHGALLDTLKQACAAAGLESVVYTFENHPHFVLFQDRVTPIIMTCEQKIRILEEKGIDAVYFERFDEAYARMTPEAFADEILRKRLNAKLAVVGYDYTFGAGGKGTAEDLKRLGAAFGLQVLVVPPVRVGDTVVSSTLLRKMIREGKMREFSAFTGRMYSIPGKVVVGRKVGRSLGFPTANIIPREGFAMPKFGVYATETLINGKMYRSVTNVGDNPTFYRNAGVTIETYIIDYNNKLYGEHIEVFFAEKIRDEMRFDSPEALSLQLKRDVLRRREMK